MTSDPHANPIRTTLPNPTSEPPIRTVSNGFEQGRFQTVSSKGGFERFRARAECARARARHAECARHAKGGADGAGEQGGGGEGDGGEDGGEDGGDEGGGGEDGGGEDGADDGAGEGGAAAFEWARV